MLLPVRSPHPHLISLPHVCVGFQQYWQLVRASRGESPMEIKQIPTVKPHVADDITLLPIVCWYSSCIFMTSLMGVGCWESLGETLITDFIVVLSFYAGCSPSPHHTYTCSSPYEDAIV